MQNGQEIFADNLVPFNTIKLISAGFDGCVKKHTFDIAASAPTVQRESQYKAQSTKSVTIVKQKSTINSIAMSNETHTLFFANDRGIITQFQKEDSSLTYYPVRTIKGHTKLITSISLSNQKMHLLSTSCDETLIVWDLQNGTQLACLNVEQKEHQSFIMSCCWNDQDTLFASGDQIGGVVVWSPPLSIYNSSNQFIAKCKFKAEGEQSRILCLKFQENGLDLLASYYESGEIRLWSINQKLLLDNKSTNATLPEIQQPKHQSKKLNVVFSFDVKGSLLVVGAVDELLLLNGNSLQSMADAQRFEIVNTLIMSSVFSKNGKYVASGDMDMSVAIFDSECGKCVKHIEKAHSSFVSAVMFQI